MEDYFTLGMALEALNRASNLQNVWWNIYATAIFALLGFISTDYAKRQSSHFHLMVLIGFIIFGLSNLFEIYILQERIVIVTQSIINFVDNNTNNIDESFYPIFDSFKIIDSKLIAGIHLFIDFVVIFILFKEYRKSTN